MPHELSFHIYPTDCDTAGHVNHASILLLLERARWAALEERLSYRDYVTRALWAVVRHVEASYSRPALPGDDFQVHTGLLSRGNTSLKVRQTAHNQRGELICEATVVYVTVTAAGKPMPVPEQWHSIFPPWD